jgi:hypothetical protein
MDVEKIVAAENLINKRRSERVLLRMTLEVRAEDEEHNPIEEQAITQVVNAHGGLLRMGKHLHVGQSFLLGNPKNKMEQSCRAVRVEDFGAEFNVAFEFDHPTPGFWPIVFPPADWVVPSL